MVFGVRRTVAITERNIVGPNQPSYVLEKVGLAEDLKVPRSLLKNMGTVNLGQLTRKEHRNPGIHDPVPDLLLMVA